MQVKQHYNGKFLAHENSLMQQHAYNWTQSLFTKIYTYIVHVDVDAYYSIMLPQSVHRTDELAYSI